MRFREAAMRRSCLILSVLCVAGVSGIAAAQPAMDFSKVEIKTTKLADGLYMLEGQGGNMMVSVGEDGAVLIDDEFAPLSAKIKAAVAAVSPKPIRFIINTHYHGDHTGGNENFAKDGVTIVAHDNVRTRLALGVGANPKPAPKEALPVITFSENASFFLNGQELFVHHLAPAHTDGDSLIQFKTADVIHTGDVFRTVAYPRIDTNAGGSYLGIIKDYETLIELGGPNTRYVPGHGVVSTKADLQDQLKMLQDILGKVAEAKRLGKSLADTQALKITAPYDARWANSPTAGDDLVAVIYNELQ
jgi:cyclase